MFIPLCLQSVLEGLNACLDHRAEVYIPELGRSFRCPPTFKVFAAQNPLVQGGGRKGLPRSFLSRFTKVCRRTVYVVLFEDSIVMMAGLLRVFFCVFCAPVLKSGDGWFLAHLILLACFNRTVSLVVCTNWFRSRPNRRYYR